MHDDIHVLCISSFIDVFSVVLTDQFGDAGIILSVVLYFASFMEGSLRVPGGKSVTEHLEHGLTCKI